MLTSYIRHKLGGRKLATNEMLQSETNIEVVWANKWARKIHYLPYFPAAKGNETSYWHSCLRRADQTTRTQWLKPFLISPSITSQMGRDGTTPKSQKSLHKCLLYCGNALHRDLDTPTPMAMMLIINMVMGGAMRKLHLIS